MSPILQPTYGSTQNYRQGIRHSVPRDQLPAPLWVNTAVFFLPAAIPLTLISVGSAPLSRRAVDNADDVNMLSSLCATSM